jgi:hypothetical protein
VRGKCTACAATRNLDYRKELNLTATDVKKNVKCKQPGCAGVMTVHYKGTSAGWAAQAELEKQVRAEGAAMSTPLGKAAYDGDWDALEAGLRAGRNPNDPKEFHAPGVHGKCSPLYFAADQGCPPALMELMLSKGANAAFVHKYYGSTALHWAAANGHAELAALLGVAPGVALDSRGAPGRRALSPARLLPLAGGLHSDRMIMERGPRGSSGGWAGILVSSGGWDGTLVCAY